MSARRVPPQLLDHADWLLIAHPSDVRLLCLWGWSGGYAEEDWDQAWAELLRRLNEQRDTLAANPLGVLLAGPPGFFALARDNAPDLWSYRAFVLSLKAAEDERPRRGSLPREAAGVSPSGPEEPARADPLPASNGLEAFAARALAPAAEPSVEVRPLLQKVGEHLRGGAVERALQVARHAQAEADSSVDRALAHAWLARVLAECDDAPGAAANAEEALSARERLGPVLADQLLEILATQPLTALQARERQVAMRRLSLERVGETPERLRDLSVSLDNVGRVRQVQGELGAALAAFTESLEVQEHLAAGFGPPWADPAWLSSLRAHIAALRSRSAAR